MPAHNGVWLISLVSIALGSEIYAQTPASGDNGPAAIRSGFFKSRFLANRLHINLGFAFTSNFIDQESKLSKLGAALGEGAARQEFLRYDTNEKRIPFVNPSQDQAGCPDVPGVTLSTPLAIREGANVPAQIFTMQGTGCSVDEAVGNALTLLGPEFQITLRYDILSWFAITTGFQFGLVQPATYFGKFRYLAQSTDIKVNGIIDPISGNPINTVGAFIDVSSAARLKISATSMEIPLQFNFIFVRSENTEAYLGIGGTLSMLTLTNQLSATQSVRIRANNQPLTLGESPIYDVENIRALTGIGLSLSIGVRQRLTERSYFFFDLRWLKGGGVITVKGTEKEPGRSYASETFAGAVLEQISAGAIPQPLQSASDASGARTIDGLTSGYAARFMMGVGYTL